MDKENSIYKTLRANIVTAIDAQQNDGKSPVINYYELLRMIDDLQTAYSDIVYGLKKNESKYKQIFNSTNEAIIINDVVSGQIVEINDRALELFDYKSRNDLVSLNFKDLSMDIYPYTNKKGKEYIIKTLKGNPQTFDWIAKKRNGESFWVGISMKLTEIEGDKRFISVIRDIAERKQSEKLLIENQEKFKAAFMISPDAISITSLTDGKYVDVNDVFVEISGYQKEEVIGKTAFELNIWSNPADRLLLTDLLKNQGYVNNLETVFNLKNDKKISALMSARILDINGEPHLLAITKDITEKKKAEEALKMAAKEWQNTFDSTADAICLLNTDQKILRANKAMFNMFNIKNEDIVNKHCWEIVHRTNKPINNCVVLRSMMTKKRESMELEMYPNTFFVTADPIFDIKDEFIGIVHIIRDITEQKKAAKEIMELNMNLEKRVVERTLKLMEANKELESFAYTVSHDLRTPLRAINGFTNILMEDYSVLLDERGQRICNTINSNALKMGQLIDDLLTFSRIGRNEMNFAVFDMKSTINAVFDDLYPEKTIRNIKLKIGDMPNIYGDRAMYKQVWSNLISNAVKFSSKREIQEIKINCDIDNEDLIFSIKDNGCGFNMKYHNKLFGVFQRLHNDKEFEGSGVGLAIVQRIIQRHGGKVWAEAELGKGAKFYFTVKNKNKNVC